MEKWYLFAVWRGLAPTQGWGYVSPQNGGGWADVGWAWLSPQAAARFNGFCPPVGSAAGGWQVREHSATNYYNPWVNEGQPGWHHVWDAATRSFLGWFHIAPATASTLRGCRKALVY